MLRPTDGVTKRGGALAPRVVAKGLGDLEEQVFGNAADVLHHLRRIASVVSLQDLKDASRILEREIIVLGARLRAALGEGFGGEHLALTRSGADVHVLVLPGLNVVGPLLRVPAAKETAQILGILEVVMNKGGGVRVS